MNKTAPSLGLEDCPIFIPPKSSMKDLAKSWVYDLITLGLQSSSKLILAEREIALLERNQKTLQLQLANGRESLELLLVDIEKVARSLNDPSSYTNFQAKMNLCKKKLGQIHFTSVKLDSNVTPLAMESLTYLKNIVLNVLTAGFYGVLRVKCLTHKKALLIHQNTHLSHKLPSEFEKTQTDYQKRIDLLEKMSLSFIKTIIAIKNEDVKKTLDDQKFQIDKKTIEMPGPLPPRFAGHDAELLKFEQYYHHNKTIDPALAGDYGLSDRQTARALFTPYTRIANNEDSSTPDQLVKNMFKYVLNEHLVSKQWLKSDQMKTAVYRKKRVAICYCVALEFIRHSQLMKIDCHGYGLKLRNDDAVILTPSLPERVERRKVKGGGLLEKTIIFKRVNAPFTPPANDPEFPYGIDPVSAALLYRKVLSKQEQRVVDTLLIESLTPHNDPNLAMAKAALTGSRGGVIDQTVGFIKEVGEAINKNFALMLDAEWEKEACCKIAIPALAIWQSAQSNEILNES
ncbi:MAG: hypothetical protein ACH350_04425 [Parachlamydiaceae bacterium]